MNTIAECTVPEQILLAAHQLEEQGQSPFSAEALIVASWKLFPATFGLKGYIELYPDSNKVLSSIMGERGLARPFLEKAKIDVSNENYTREVLTIVKEKIKLLKELPEWTSYFFAEDYEFDPAAVEKVFGKPEAVNRLKALRDEFARHDKWDWQSLEATLKSLAQKLGCKTGDLVHPARIAVSGRGVGPSLYHMLEVMGKERVLKRFDCAVEKFSK